MPTGAQNQLEETEKKTYAAGPVTFTLDGLMADGQIAYLSASARMTDGSKALLYPNADPEDSIGENLAQYLALAPETTWQEAAAQTGLPLYGLMAWLEPEGDVMGGEEMMDAMIQPDGSVLLVDMLYTDPAKVGESLKGQVTLWAYELDSVTFERKDEGWRMAEKVQLPVTGILEEREYTPNASVKLSGGFAVTKVTAEKRAAGVYVNVHLKAKENTTLGQAMQSLDLSLLDQNGQPFPAGVSFTSEFLDENGQKFPQGDTENLVVANLVYRTMTTTEELPEGLMITDGNMVTLK